MKNDVLLVIDSYISDQKRADSCLNLIKQLKDWSFKGYEILLINKSNTSFDLQKHVDYYLNISNSFFVGYPPQNILDNQQYERPYVYVNTDRGTFENWMPLTGVTDHVVGIYNSFILSSKFAKSLGYKKIFKIEYDTDFDKSELEVIKSQVDSFKDFLFYGKRQEGEYAKPYHYLIDVHICGYSPTLFEGFDLINNDKEFWDLCTKINYYGKWIEYIIPSILEYNKKFHLLEGVNLSQYVKNRFPKSKFDIINSPSWWTEKWDHLPIPCKIKKGNDIEKDKIEIFFWNDKNYNLYIKTKIINNGELVKDFNLNLSPRTFLNETFNIEDKLTIISEITSENLSYTVEHIVEKDKLHDLTYALQPK